MALLWVVAIILAFLPALGFLLYIRRLDKFEPEPWRMIGRAFLAGCLSVIPAMLVEIPLAKVHFPGMLGSAWTAFVVAALTEEFFKGAFGFGFMWRRPEFNEVMDGIVYFGTAHMGFAVVENLGYIFLNSEGNIVTAMMNAFVRTTTAVPLHVVNGMIMGYHLGVARFARNWRERISHFVQALAIPILLHGIYDLAAFEGELTIIDGATLLRTGFGTALLYAAVVLLWVFLLPRVKAAQDASPFKPKEWPTLPTAPTSCTRCGSLYPMGANYCHNCAAPVSKQQGYFHA